MVCIVDFQELITLKALALHTSSLKGPGRCVASSRTLGLDTVSTGSGSDLVSDQYAIFVMILTRIVDQSLSLPVLTVSKNDLGF